MADESTHGSTLFVSNLPYTATSVDLQTLFSDVGPVRSAFIVQDKESKVSKGVGYVSFAIKDDAERAFEHENLNLDGRKLRIQWPSQQNKDVGDGAKPVKREKAAAASTSSPSKPTTPHDALAIRTVIITGLPADVTSKVLWKKIRKEDGAEDVKYPVEGSDGVAHAVFTTPKHAYEAAKHLHAHVFKGSILSAAVKKRMDVLKNKKNGAPTRANRLIVRNLPFDVTEADLQATFLPFGPVHSISIPRQDQEQQTKDEEDEAEPSTSTSTPRAKGFAFVWFLSKNDAEKAIKGANQKPLRSAADAGQTMRKSTAKGKNKEKRLIAVDWALSKSRWEEEKAKMEQEDKMDVDDEQLASASEDESGSSSDEDEEAALGVHASSSDSSHSSDSESDGENNEDEAPKDRPQLPATDVGTTLFIRNVPYDATDDDLRTLFRAFGPLRYARVTLDKESGRSRGTGFACFWNKTDADAVIEHAKLMQQDMGVGEPSLRKNPFSMHSILTPDPSSSLAKSLVLHGRTLDVTRAVTRTEASTLATQNEKAREKADKRNLYLMREGVIFPNSPAASTLPSVELEKRTNAYNARRTLLRGNPSLYISKTRLSVRQVPLWVSERVLKRLAIHATRAFEDEVKSGGRQALDADELHEDSEEEGEEKENAKEKRKKRRGERPTVVTQAKVVRQADRLDPLTGKGRSRGYGFLQMVSHADALRVLRWANNNPAVEGLMRAWFKSELEDLLKGKGVVKKEDGRGDGAEEEKARKTRIKAKIAELEDAKEGKAGGLILEFSIENVQVVKKRREKQEASSEQAAGQGKKRSLMDTITKSDEAPRKPKRRRVQEQEKEPTAEVPAAENDQDPGDSSKTQLARMIGRKRMQRKARRAV